jgi:hypothetical protein
VNEQQGPDFKSSCFPKGPPLYPFHGAPEWDADPEFYPNEETK